MFTALIRANFTPLLRSFQSGAEARNASSTKIHHSLSFKTSPFLNYLAVTETSIAANIGRALMIMQSNTSLLHQAPPTWFLTSAHFKLSRQMFKSNQNENIWSVREFKKNLILFTNFRVENVLTICISSPPSCNYGWVALVVLSFDNFIGVNGESESYIHMIRNCSLLFGQTYD